MIEPLAGHNGPSAAGVLSVSELLEHASGTRPHGRELGDGLAAALRLRSWHGGRAVTRLVARGGRGHRTGGTLQARCLALARQDVEAFGRAAAALERGTDVEEPLRRTVDVLLPLGEAACDVAELAARRRGSLRTARPRRRRRPRPWSPRAR